MSSTIANLILPETICSLMKIPRHHSLSVAGLLGILFILCITSIKIKSPTRDEPAHLARGIAVLNSGDFRLSVAHPPLGNMLSALPTLFLRNLDVPFNHSSWFREDKNAFWIELFKRNLDRAERLLFISRLVTIALAVLLGFLVYTFAKELFGNLAGFLALVLFTFSPNIIAHSRLATTDLMATLGVFSAVYALYFFVCNPSRKTLLLSGVLLGIANLLKFSGVLLYPIYIILLSAAALFFSRYKKQFEGGADPLDLPFGLSRTPPGHP